VAAGAGSTAAGPRCAAHRRRTCLAAVALRGPRPSPGETASPSSSPGRRRFHRAERFHRPTLPPPARRRRHRRRSAGVVVTAQARAAPPKPPAPKQTTIAVKITQSHGDIETRRVVKTNDGRLIGTLKVMHMDGTTSSRELLPDEVDALLADMHKPKDGNATADDHH